MVCEKCGTEVPESSVFCLKCGSKINTVQTGNSNKKHQRSVYRPLVGTTWLVKTLSEDRIYHSLSNDATSEITFEQYSNISIRPVKNMSSCFGKSSRGTWKQYGKKIVIEINDPDRLSTLEGKLIADSLIALRDQNNFLYMLINF